MSRREGGAALLLALVVSSCVPAPAAPTPLPPTASPVALARETATLLARMAAYDYALAGHFAGERVRVVAPERYATALAREPAAVAALKDKVVKAALGGSTAARELVDVADAAVSLAAHLTLFFDAKDPDAFVRVVRDVDGAWSALRVLAAQLPPDDELRATTARGTAWTITVGRGRAYAVVTAPYATRDEAVQAARALGAVEQVAQAAPFTVRVATYADRAAAEARVQELRGSGVVAAPVEVDRFSFARGGPPPSAELWREPAVDVPVWFRGRRANFTAAGFAVASDDGSLYGFDDQARLVWFQRLAPGPSVVAPSADGRLFLAGGQSLGVFTSDGAAIASPAARLPSAAAAAVWVDRRRVFVAASQGPTGKPEGGGGSVMAIGTDGKPLGDPFPLVTPAAGPALATSAAREDVYIATTSRGTTDVEAIRPGVEARARLLVRVAGQVADLVVDADATYAVLVTSQGTYRFRLAADAPTATLERIAPPARDVQFASDGTLYVLLEDRLLAYDRGLRALWTVTLSDGRRVLVARRIVVQDGLSRTIVIDPRSGSTDELASVGETNDVAVSADGGRVLLLVDGRRAVIFTLP